MSCCGSSSSDEEGRAEGKQKEEEAKSVNGVMELLQQFNTGDDGDAAADGSEPIGHSSSSSNDFVALHSVDGGSSSARLGMRMVGKEPLCRCCRDSSQPSPSHCSRTCSDSQEA